MPSGKKTCSPRLGKHFLTKSGRKIEVLTLMMDNVGSPEKIAFMAGAVQPVVAKVINDNGQGNSIPRFPEIAMPPARDMLIKHTIQANLKKWRACRYGLTE